MTDEARTPARSADLLYLASHDPLTGLANRTLFMDHAARALASAGSQTHAICFLDLDSFKRVNDFFGHGAGDDLLVEVGQRLRSCLRPADTAARFGGDEFVVLLDGVAEASDALSVAERILDECRRPFHLGAHEIAVTVSIGVALATANHRWPTELLRDADMALYRAKSAGGGCAILFDTGMNAETIARVGLEAELERALERREFRLYYQPEIDLKQNRIVGMEALLRWQHPERGLIHPGDIIPIAEKTGLILPISDWVLEEACRELMTLTQARASYRQLVVGVNVSPRQFREGSLVGQVGRALSTTGLQPESLRLEITESALIQNVVSATRNLEALQQLGTRLALDDFGTGYSSLSYLRQFPVHVLKVDYSFVRDLDQPKTAAIVRAIVELAHALGMTVTAEGIERVSQRDLLRSLGCDRAQGYYFWKPLSASELTGVLMAALP